MVVYLWDTALLSSVHKHFTPTIASHTPWTVVTYPLTMGFIWSVNNSWSRFSGAYSALDNSSSVVFLLRRHTYTEKK